MTNKALLFCTLAVTLAIFSISMVPMTPAPISNPATASTSPVHSLTGVSFHSVSAGF